MARSNTERWCFPQLIVCGVVLLLTHQGLAQLRRTANPWTYIPPAQWTCIPPAQARQSLTGHRDYPAPPSQSHSMAALFREQQRRIDRLQAQVDRQVLQRQLQRNARTSYAPLAVPQRPVRPVQRWPARTVWQRLQDYLEPPR